MKEPIEYFGGTPTAEEGYKVKSQSLVSSIWDNFTKSISESPMGAAAAIGLKGLGWANEQAAGPIASQQVTVVGANTYLNSLRSGKTEEEAKAAKVAAEEKRRPEVEAAKKAGFLTPLSLAASGTEAAWSTTVARPASTAALLANPNSPLYKTGTVEQLGPNGETEIVPTEAGFQWSDVNQAWNRSEDVSFGQAAAANPLTKALPQVDATTQIITRLGGLDQYDPWSVQDMADAQDNPFYKFVTGSTDFGLQIVVPPAVKIARLAAFERLGLTTSLKSGETLAGFRSDWERYLAGDTADNPWGDYITDIAETTNPTLIRKSPIVANANGVDKGKLTSILQRTNDPDTVNEIALALHGDEEALLRLNAAAPDDVWALADLSENLQNMWMRSERYRPQGAELAGVNQVFDSALNRNEYFSDVRRFFMSNDGFARTAETWVPTRANVVEDGPVWTPLVNWLSKKSTTTVEKIRDAKGKTSYAISESDFEAGPQWLYEVSKSPVVGAPTTTFLHWVGRRQPLGTVTRSGARPSDLWEEQTANLDTVPLFRGDGVLKVGRELNADGQVVDTTMSVAQYRQFVNQKVLDGLTEGRLQAAWLETEDDIVRVMARTEGVDEELALRMVDGYRKAMLDDFGYLQNNGGYLWDELHGRMILSPKATSQMLDAFPTLPLGDIYNAIRGEGSLLLRAGQTGQDIGIAAYDYGNKIFRTNVLFRFGYIPKNSLGEPLLASIMAHGTALAADGVAATIGNAGKNMANRSLRFVYATNLDRLAKKVAGKAQGPSRREIRKELKALINQREQAKTDIENLTALHTSLVNDAFGPTIKQEHAEVVKGQLFDAQILLNNIEDAMDNRMPQWRQVVEPPTLYGLTENLRQVKAVVGQDEEYVNILRTELDDIERAATERSRAAGPRARLESELGTIQKQIDDADKRLEHLSENFDNPRVDKTGVSVAQNQEDVVARGRDLQGIAIQRQREGLIAQRDALMEQLDNAPNDVIDFTPNEAGRKAQIESILSRVNRRAAAANDETVVEKVAELQKKYDDIVDGYNLPARDYSKAIEDLQAEVESLTEKIGVKEVEQGLEVGKLEAVKGIRAHHGSGDGTTTLYVGGLRLEIPSIYADRSLNFSAGYRAEASAANTARQTYDPSVFTAHGIGRWKIGEGPALVEPTAPTYWGELDHVGNRIFRNDKLIVQIMSAPEGSERQVAAQWLTTPEGREYQKVFGINYLQVRETRAPARPLAKVDGAKSGPGVKTVVLDSTTELDDMIRLVKQYFPDDRVRKELVDREVRADEMQAMMGARADLAPVIGRELNYQPNRVQRVNEGINKALDKIWQFASANIEDRTFRWPFLDREYRNQLQTRLNILQSQGGTIGAAEANALSQSAKRAALVEMEKTFYNIRRYSTPVYAMRFLMGFPGAFFNSLYRYGRFAVKEPERMFTAVQMYGNMLENMGVDAEGRPTGKDLTKAVYLVIPGTRENPEDPGFRIPVASFEGLAVGNPGLSFLATMAVSVAVQNNPTTEEIMKNALGDTMYEQVFPYGIPKDPRSAVLGAYQKELLSWVGSFDAPLVGGAINKIVETIGVSDEKFLTTATQIYADQMAQYEKNGSEGEPPTFEGALSDARWFILTSGGIKFANPGSTNRPVAGQLMRDEWYSMREAYGPERTDEARLEYIKKYGDWSRWYTQSGSSYQAYIPSTQDAYTRVYKDFPYLAEELLSWDKDNPSMVALLAIGTKGEFSESVSNFLRSNPLPGDSEPVYQKLDPKQFAAKVQIDDGWTWNEKNSAKYEAERTRIATLRDQSNTAAEKQYYRQWLAKVDKSWDDAVAEYGATNVPWLASKSDPGGAKAEKAAIYLTKILQDDKFLNGPGQEPVWRTIDQFLADRVSAKAAIKNESSTEKKQILKNSFLEYVQNELIKNDPDFGGVFNRYFSGEWMDQ